MPRPSAIEFRDVRLDLGGRTILDGVNLDIGGGEFIGVLGPNGAGKTTLMRAILGLVPPARGRIQVLGRPASRGNPAIGYMPQIARRPGRVAAQRLGFRGRAPLDGHRWACPGSAAPRRAEVDRGARRWSARRRWRAGRSPSCPAASGSACCWRRRCSAARGCCCSTSR